MSEVDTQSVLRCGECNKPFDKQSTLKRHGYYCRSRRTGAPRRARSCVSCAKGKVRCDNRQPECSRCKAKALECHYPAHTRSRPQPRDDVPVGRGIKAPSLAPDLQAIAAGDITLDDALDISASELASFENEYPSWDDPDIDFTSLLDPQTENDNLQCPSPASSSLISHSTLGTDEISQGQQAISYPTQSISRLPSYNIRSFIQRSDIKTGTLNLILRTLKSYPLTMLRHNALPPFIHPHLIQSNMENNSDMEALTNCISLMHMISNGVQGSRKLFWKNVRLECERFIEKHMSFNKWELLTAIQALLIYVLVRMDEGPTDYNDFDSLLTTAIIVISSRLAYIATTIDHSVEPTWEDWVFEESKRRLCVVYRVVDMLVYFEPAALCDVPTHLILSPLPARKQLWEAANETIWKSERDRDPEVQTAFGLASNGELIKLSESEFSRCKDAVLLRKSPNSRKSSTSTENWEEWCAGMDGFGGLVMLAASLLA
ncbi:hypothetical protein FQN54_001078 [Arachnomyces sp. PD_36]|nr:hypothetical protein FQN54_001078 [Arachnomyces sp. PD_36]